MVSISRKKKDKVESDSLEVLMNPENLLYDTHFLKWLKRQKELYDIGVIDIWKNYEYRASSKTFVK